MPISTFSKLMLTASLLALLSGCAAMGSGHSNYSCEGFGDDASASDGCMSVREAYAATDSVSHAGDGEAATPPTQQAIDNAMHVAQHYVAPRLPDQAVPIRTPADVMRIWIAPWESDNGDLNVTGHVYTEIEPRRWVLGSQPGGTQSRALSPLR